MFEKNALIIRNIEGFLTGSLERSLSEKKITVKKIGPDVDEIRRYGENADAIILYVGHGIHEKTEAMVYLKDLGIEQGMPIFLIDGDEGLAEIKQLIPEAAITQTFTHPVDIKEATAMINNCILQNDNTNRRKILVVDDSGPMLRNLREWLGGKYKVIPANSGAMAMKYISRELPDLILLDYEMPVVNGKQVLEMIRTEVDFQSIPVIFLTSRNDKESVASVMALRPQGYLLKTLPPEEIINSIDDFFVKLENEEKQKKLW
ncbi:MAG: response regulator [Lachnospiraceae bacterium]|nr:response regulator [Lachnospiraceae bacterium]